MTTVAATRRDRRRNFLQPGVVLECPFRTPWKQGFVEGGMCSREDNVIWSAHENIALSSRMHTKESHQFGFGGHLVLLYLRGDEDIGPTT